VPGVSWRERIVGAGDRAVHAVPGGGAGVWEGDEVTEWPKTDTPGTQRRARPSYPPYTGEDATCPKCGNEEVSTCYQPYGQFRGSATEGGFLVSGYEPTDWLARVCDRCDHAWPEACIDNAEHDDG
jgi:hypothetical protein